MSMWSDLWRSESRSWAWGRIPGPSTDHLTANASYVAVTLRSFRIAKTRVGGKRFYGALQSTISLPSIEGSLFEAMAIIAPPKLRDVATRNLDRFEVGSRLLFGLTPYRGGRLDLEIGLLAVRSQDLLAPYLDLLVELATVAGVAFAGPVIPFVGPIKKGLQQLTKASAGVTLEVGLSHSLDAPVPGNYFVARATKDSVGSFSLDDQFRLVCADNREMPGVPYIVFSIDAAPVRDDWFMIPDIAAAYGRLRDSVREDAPGHVFKYYKTAFERAVRASPDLLPAHAEQVIREVVKQASPPAKMTSLGARAELAPLESITLTPVQSSPG